MYVFGGGGRHHSEFGWELEVRVLRKEVLWSERGGCLSGKRGSCPADVVEAVTRIIDIGSIAVLWSRGLSCFDDLTAEPDVFSEIGYEGITLVDQGYIPLQCIIMRVRSRPAPPCVFEQYRTI